MEDTTVTITSPSRASCRSCFYSRLLQKHEYLERTCVVLSKPMLAGPSCNALTSQGSTSKVDFAQL